jgi:hypothetical protein
MLFNMHYFCICINRHRHIFIYLSAPIHRNKLGKVVKQWYSLCTPTFASMDVGIFLYLFYFECLRLYKQTQANGERIIFTTHSRICINGCQHIFIYMSAPVCINELGQALKYDIILHKKSWGKAGQLEVWGSSQKTYSIITSITIGRFKIASQWPFSM